MALYLIKEKAVVISDLHLGLEEALNKQGYLIPLQQFKDINDRLKKIFDENEVNEVIFNGDVKHEFGTILNSEWSNITRIFELVSNYCEKIVIIKGNHDMLLEPIARKMNIIIQDYCKINEYFISHGDKIIDNLEFQAAKTIIISNEHTAISLRKGGRKELYKCFLVGKFKDKTLIAMPSFNTLTEGTDVLNGGLLSPMLQQDLGEFQVYIAADKIYDFGKVKDIKNMIN